MSAITEKKNIVRRIFEKKIAFFSRLNETQFYYLNLNLNPALTPSEKIWETIFETATCFF